MMDKINRGSNFTSTDISTGSEFISSDDAAWALSCAFLILTMQTGFAMLECGHVSQKNTANIMIKNLVDVCFGGLSYWCFGYAFSFGTPSNFFCGFGDFFFHRKDTDTQWLGSSHAHYFFHFSFATTATTIVSGAVAERMKFHSYTVFSFLNTLIYVFPASWVWNVPKGFLYQMGFYDFAGTSVVHLVGGTAALVASLMLGPRLGRFENPEKFSMSSPVTAMTGMFMLFWAWLGFNCGSTFLISNEVWKVTAKVAITTLNGAIGGGVTGIIMSNVLHRGKTKLEYVINSLLGGLVSVTGISAVTSPWEALIIGAVAAFVAAGGKALMDKAKIDDPVGAVPVHFACSVWGTLATGLFARDNVLGSLKGREGLFHSGEWQLLGVQTAGLMILFFWTILTTTAILLTIKLTMGIRCSADDEILGADWVEHDIWSEQVKNQVNESANRACDEAVQTSQPIKLAVTDLATSLRKTVSSKDTRRVESRNIMFGVDVDPDDPYNYYAIREGAEETLRKRSNGKVQPSQPTSAASGATMETAATSREHHHGRHHHHHHDPEHDHNVVYVNHAHEDDVSVDIERFSPHDEGEESKKSKKF